MELTYANNPQSLFRKYARFVTWFANTQVGRDYLKHNNLYIPSEKIDLLLPNGYIRNNGKQKQLVVTTKACFSPRLTPFLRGIEAFQGTLRETQELLLWMMGLRHQPIWATTTLYDSFGPVYPDVDPESTTVDGLVYAAATNATWADLRADAGDGALPSAAASTIAGWSTGSSSNRFDRMRRGIFLYDTSGIPDTATITSVTHEVYNTSNADIDSNTPALVLVASTPASNTNLVAGDYAQFGTTRFATDISYPGSTVNAYITHTLNASGLAAISKTGISKFGTMTDNDFDNAAPNWATSGGEVGRYTANYADVGSNKPKLTITYTVGNNIQINIGDVWKKSSAVKINIGDVWKTVTKAQINIGDVWKTIFSS